MSHFKSRLTVGHINSHIITQKDNEHKAEK